MNVLVTGGAGYIGSHVVVALFNAGHKVRIIDNLSSSDKQALDGIQEILKTNIPFIKGDVRDVDLVCKALMEYKVDSVIHLAGLKSVGESLSDPLNYYQNNIAGLLSLLEAMKRAKVMRLVFSSSATVYGVPKYLPIDEAHILSPINPYGRTKLQSEEILFDLSSSNPDWKIICLRYFNPVGAHQSGLIGENPVGRPNNIFPYLLDVILKKYDFFSIFGSDYKTTDGTGVRDYIHIEDLAEGHIAALNYLHLLNGCDFFNLGTGTGCSVLELIAVFESIINTDIPIKLVERREGDVASCFAGVNKANEILGWKAKRKIEEMCLSGLKWAQYKNCDKEKIK
jgi:UDP-glucose 4-epimerase